ncbi:hypothetical protein BYT27DRAFT_7093757 [Phlegmacium glaucopus]|nr:hypothetical protein BYT27DRAFT_7093757 [Phlegmacium glaucopus]
MDVDNFSNPGCYVLDFGIKGIQPQKIWIRADYKLIYDELEGWFNVDPIGKAPSAIVTGQPGIGKSIWIYYALRRRLGEQKPIIWYYSEGCYLFVNEGVFKKPKDFLPVDFKQLVWTLVDSGTVPTPLVDQGTRLFIIFTTSPNKTQWKDLNKSTRFTTCIMDPWTWQEMLQLVSITNLSIDLATTIYDTYGPMPRLWIDLNEQQERTRYESEVHTAINNMTSSKLEQLIADTVSLTMDGVSCKLYLISRVDPVNPRSLHIIAPITHNIQSMLANHFRHCMERLDVIRLYKKFAKIPESRKVAGMLFEAFGQQLLQENIMLDMVPMVQLRSVPTGKPQLNSSHIFLVNPELEASRQAALGRMSRLDVKPTRVVESGGTPPSVEEGIYYLPKKTNQVAIDSFIVSGGSLYLFQFTIGEHHDVKAGLKTFLEACPGIPAEDNWCFVFIIPTDQTVMCPQLPDALRGIAVCSAAIAVE